MSRAHGVWLRDTCLLVATLALTLGGAGAVRAADEAAVLRLRAEQLSLRERCAEAVPILQRVRSLDPSDARAALLEGQCEIRRHRYQEAIAPLEDARRLDPGLAEATLDLAIANYHAGNLEAAERELGQAERLLPDRAEVHLYRGLVLLERAELAEAAAALEQARALDPGTADPAASYFAGRAWQVARERERAEQALGRVISDAPGTPWALEAERALDRSQSRYRRRGAWARLTAGMEYDTNVTLRGNDVVQPSGISGKKDGRGVWYTRTGTELFRSADWAGGLMGAYYGDAHIDVPDTSKANGGDFDTHFPTLSAWLDRSLSEETYFRFQPEFGYAWIDYDDYLLMPGATLSLHHAFERAGLGRFFFRFQHRDYLFNVSNPAQNRDGEKYIGGYDHAYFPTDNLELRATVGANYYNSESGEYTYVGPAVGVGGRLELPYDFAFDMDFLYRHQRYDNRSAFSVQNKRRRDDLYQLWTALEHTLTDSVKISARYRYVNDDANVDVFNYTRHIIGGYFTLEFGP